MRKFIILLILNYSFLLCSSQNSGILTSDNEKVVASSLNIKTNKDSLEYWEYNYFESEPNENGKIGELIFRRTEFVKNSVNGDSLLPRILFSIYPIEFYDSINKFENDRAMMLSCCYPVCGATIIKIRNFVLYSNPFEIKCAFDCSGIDYTRWNIENILKNITENKYSSFKDLLDEIPIRKNENIK